MRHSSWIKGRWMGNWAKERSLTLRRRSIKEMNAFVSSSKRSIRLRNACKHSKPITALVLILAPMTINKFQRTSKWHRPPTLNTLPLNHWTGITGQVQMLRIPSLKISNQAIPSNNQIKTINKAAKRKEPHRVLTQSSQQMECKSRIEPILPRGYQKSIWFKWSSLRILSSFQIFLRIPLALASYLTL